MKKNILKGIILALAIPAVLVSCVQEMSLPETTEHNAPVRRVTISAGLPAQTKVAHSLNGTSIHPTWEAGDKVNVVFEQNGKEVTEIFELLKGEGTQSAVFFNDGSQLGDNTPFSVHYPVTEKGWAMQKGTLDDLPESLSARVAKLGESAKLEPALTYFHIVFDDFRGGEFTLAQLNKLEGDFTMYVAPGVPGVVSVAPSNGFTSGKVDFYVAVMLDGPTTGTVTDDFGDEVPVKLQISFGNWVQGISTDNQAEDMSWGCKFNWTPEKDYLPGNVYKLENKPVVSTNMSASQPR